MTRQRLLRKALPRILSVFVLGSGSAFQAIAASPEKVGASLRQELQSAVGNYWTKAVQLSFENLPPFDQWQVFTPPARIPRSSLQVTDMQWDPIQNSLRLRLRCQPRSTCLPFFVFIPIRPARLQSIPQKQDHSTTLVKPGQRVQLLVEQPGMRLNQPAICLDDGRIGDIVRVRPRSRSPWVYARVLRNDVVQRVDK